MCLMLNKKQLTFQPYTANILVRLPTVNMKKSLTPKSENMRPHSSNSIENASDDVCCNIRNNKSYAVQANVCNRCLRFIPIVTCDQASFFSRRDKKNKGRLIAGYSY